MPGRRQLYAVENLLGLADQAIRLLRRELFAALRLHLVAVGIDLVAAFLGVPFRNGFGVVNPAQSTTHAASTPALALADEADSCWGRRFRGLSRGFQATQDTQPDWFASSARAAVAMGLAALIAGVFNLEHGFWIALGILPVLRAGDTAGARTFLQEQGGTLAGFMSSAALVALVRSHRGVYWIALPITAFVAAYVSTAMGFVAGQAAFTLSVVVMLNILTPLGYRAEIPRLEDIAIGGAISLVLGAEYPIHRGKES